MKRWGIPISILLVLLGGVALCIVRWNAWFGNIAEPTYSVPAFPTNIVLTVGENASTQRTISWRTQKVLPSVLRLTNEKGEITTYSAEGRMVESRMGEAAFYSVRLDSLTPGRYTYKVKSADYCSDVYSFTISPDSAFRFLLFGDIQEGEYPNPFSEFIDRYEGYDSIAFMAYVGDVIERPIDDYWQVWFSSMQQVVSSVPQLPVAGNHEYIKGICRQIDSRWTSVFPMPENGPERFLGRSYYVDYPTMRIICLDTEALQRFSDYTVLQCWLLKNLLEAGDKWKVVVMHHAVYSAGAGRQNPMILVSFRETLKYADLVFAGHDHNYARRIEYEHIGRHGKQGDFITPVWVVTSSSTKQYLPKLDNKCQRIGTNHAFYEEVNVSNDSIMVRTYMMDNDSLYDQFTILSNPERIVDADTLMPEIIELPTRYEGKNSLSIRRFLNARDARLSNE